MQRFVNEEIPLQLSIVTWRLLRGQEQWDVGDETKERPFNPGGGLPWLR